MFSELSQLWEGFLSDFIEQSNDKVTIHYKPVRAGQSNDFDSFFNESTDSSNPKDIHGITETPKDPVDVFGKTHFDLYGATVSNSEQIQQIGVGQFQNSDALFTCLLGDVIIDGDKTRTVFDEADYIVVDKDGNKYEVVAQKRRGLGDAFVLDVFMKETNK